MAYVPHTWKDGELLRAEDLNHLEQGVMNEQIGPVGPEGKPGRDGATGPAGRDGADGQDGQTPHIGANGNWWIGDTDTGISASGPTGATGPKGEPGKDGVGIPAGGAAGQVLAKKTAEDYDTQWVDPPEGGGETDGVSSFNGRSGAVMPQSGDYTAENISFTPGTGMTAKNVQSAITELFTSGSEGKAKIASAVTAKGVETAADASFDTMQANILAIPAGGLPEDVCTIDVQASNPDGGIVSGGGVASMGMKLTVEAKKKDGFNFINWVESGEEVTTATEYTFNVEQNRNLTAVFEEKLAHIYGAEWDGTSTTKWARTDESAGFSKPVPYVSGATRYSSPFDALQPWAGMVKIERTGGTMVAIPKFWYKLEQNGAGLKIQIADAKIDGFATSPAHMDRGDGKGERDVVYIGRYHCGSDYKSKTGVIPKTEITRSVARSGIHALGDTIWQNDFAMRFTIWLLYIVEFADWNSQSTIGYGTGDNVSAQKMGYTNSMPYHTGTTQPDQDAYGIGTQYRNIEGLWDNVYDWCDGCYNASNGMNIILNPSNFSDSSGGNTIGTPVAGYPAGFTVSETGGFQLFFSSKKGGSSWTYSCDNWSFGAPYPVVFVGGSYRRGGDCGLFSAGVNIASFASDAMGSRIMELP